MGLLWLLLLLLLGAAVFQFLRCLLAWTRWRQVLRVGSWTSDANLWGNDCCLYIFLQSCTPCSFFGWLEATITSRGARPVFSFYYSSALRGCRDSRIASAISVSVYSECDSGVLSVSV